MAKIRFRCSSCDRTLAIDAVHAGKVVACPSCRAKLKLPDAPDNTALAGSTAAPLPSQTLKQTKQPNPPRRSANPFDQDFGATFDEASDEYSSADESYDGGDGSGNRRSFGRSLGGVAAAIFLGGVFSIIWVVIVALTEREVGIIAWGMGGAIGFSAGIIARNPSRMYCGLIAGIAVMSVLAAKAMLLGLLMLALWGMGFIADLAALLPDHDVHSHVIADQMLQDGEFTGLEKEYAEIYTSSYFSDDDEAYDRMNEELYDVISDVNSRISDRLENATEEEKKQLIKAARTRHPEWIEDDNHYHAIIDRLSREEGALDDDLAAQAAFELGQIENDWDAEYNNEVAHAETRRRHQELRRLAAEQLQTMDEQARDQAVRDAMQHRPKWNAFPDAYMAMVAKLHNDGALESPLAEHAEATVTRRILDEDTDYFDNVASNDSQARDDELRALVNQKLIAMDAAARESLLAETRIRYPDWVGEELTVEQAKQQLEDSKQRMIEELGTDGTMLGNLGAVFGFMDIVWLILSATTAYGVAYKQGTEE